MQCAPFLNDKLVIMVIDGCVGFTGGVNIADEYINQDSCPGYQKDSGIKINGKAVYGLAILFLSTGHSCRC